MITGNEPAIGFGYNQKMDNPRYGRGSSDEFITTNVEYNGLTIRQDFAARAMAAILGNEDLRTKLLADKILDGTTNENYIAAYALKNANALIAELNKQP